MYYKGCDLNIDRITKYYMKNTNSRTLEAYGFRYRRTMSDSDDSVYEYIFPVYRYHDSISLEARFLLHQESHTIVVDVFDSGSHGIYAPWYYDNSGIAERIVHIINRNIAKEMKKLHITRHKEDKFKE